MVVRDEGRGITDALDNYCGQGPCCCWAHTRPQQPPKCTHTCITLGPPGGSVFLASTALASCEPQGGAALAQGILEMPACCIRPWALLLFFLPSKIRHTCLNDCKKTELLQSNSIGHKITWRMTTIFEISHAECEFTCRNQDRLRQLRQKITR